MLTTRRSFSQPRAGMQPRASDSGISLPTPPSISRKGSLVVWDLLVESPSYLVRNPTLAPQLEKTHETPQSSRNEGLLLLYGLESNPESSLQTPQEA